MVWYIRFLKTPKIDQNGHVRALITVTTDLGDGFYPDDLTLHATITSNETWMSEWRIVEWKKGMRTLWIDIGNVEAHSPVDLRLIVNCERSFEGNGISVESMPEFLGVWSDLFGEGNSQAGGIIQRRYKPVSKVEKVIIEETGESIARHIWDAGLALVAFLGSIVLQPRPTSKFARLLQKSNLQDLSILELGSGCGITGLHIADLCSRSTVLLTDLPDAMEILNRNVELAQPVSSEVKFTTAVLDWNAPIPEIVAKQRFDLVVLSDCTYNSDNIPGLVRTLSSIARGSLHTLIVISLKVRHDSEAIFFDLMARANFVRAEQAAIPLPDRCRSETGQDLEVVEIYIYRNEGPWWAD